MSLRLNELWVPLLSTSVNASVVDEDATVLLTQQFANPHFKQAGKLLEAIYNFPLQSTAAVYFFKTVFLSETGEIIKTLVGKAIDKKGARDKYEEAKANGQAAQLLEQDFENSPDVFIFSLGNIPSDVKTVNVEIGYYVALMEEEKGNVRRFLFPATLVGRKRKEDIPSTLVGRVGRKIFNPWTKQNVSTKDSSFEIEVNVSLSEHISLVESPSHRITTKLMIDKVPSKASVSCSVVNEVLKDDFVLKIGGGEAPRSMMLVQDPSSIMNDTFLKTFGDATIAKLVFRCPDSREEEVDGVVKQNFVFMVDNSISMKGKHMKKCKKVLQICLSSLPENCVFNICSTGSNESFLFPESKEYSKDSIKEARSYVNAMRANKEEETEILTPLKKSVQLQNSGLPKVVFLLTAGNVSGNEEIVQLMKNAHEKSGIRMFTCGIESEVSTHLVEGLAKAGGGTATFIAYNEKISRKIKLQMEQAKYPPFEKLRVEMGDLEVCKAKIAWDVNSLLPRLALTGQSLSCFIALDTGSMNIIEEKVAAGESVEMIKLIGTQNTFEGENEMVVAEIDLSADCYESECNLVVPALKEQIKLAEAATKKSEKNRALELCLCANIVSKFTSLVAVEKLSGGETVEASAMPTSHWNKKEYEKIKIERKPPRVLPQSTFQKIRIITSNSNRFSTFPTSHSVNLTVSSTNSFIEPYNPEPERSLRSTSTLSISFSKRQRRKEGKGRKFPLKIPKFSLIKKDITVEAVDERLETLAKLQNANGSYDPTPELAKLVGKDYFGENEGAAGFATAVAIVFMEDRLPTLRARWKLQHKKAMKSLKKTSKNYKELLTLAREFI